MALFIAPFFRSRKGHLVMDYGDNLENMKVDLQLPKPWQSLLPMSTPEIEPFLSLNLPSKLRPLCYKVFATRFRILDGHSFSSWSQTPDG